ncbi:hypothetical protein [Tautonia marina]|uniref:hypothetical protein n=1 Tax=Tautonia marina TaxID=2653855 RepID=UPI0012608CB5|nr:hypothetical protein [Tautonia marina]
MPRPIRAGGLSTLSLALCLSMSGVLAGCGDQAAEEPVPLGGGPGINPAEPGQTTIPDVDRDAGAGATAPDTNADQDTPDIPVSAEPEAPGTGS